jgi:D-3-phosphoglycerate dehydrogenase / 2-oxoglutarate reductase
LLRVNIYSKAGKFTVAGTTTPDGAVRIKDIDGYQFDLEPAPFMLAVNNADKPGMIGRIGTVLGAENVNIGNMQVSRNAKEGIAMMIMTVDSAVERHTLETIRSFEGITNAANIRM